MALVLLFTITSDDNVSDYGEVYGTFSGNMPYI
jgi:hypothetical protein